MSYNDDILIEQYRDLCKTFEGDVHHFYLDSAGKLTIGRGHYVQENSREFAGYLRFVDNNKLVTEDDVNAEINALKQFANGNYNRSASHYVSVTKLRLKSIDEIWQKDVQKKIIRLRSTCSYFADPATPNSAKLVMLDLAFQSGERHLADSGLNADIRDAAKQKVNQTLLAVHGAIL